MNPIILIIKKCLGVKGIRLAKSLFFPSQLQINRNGIKFTVNSKQNYEFWLGIKKGKWEYSNTFAIFDKFLNRQHSYVDIGAHIGSTVLYGCQLAKHCYAIEPDPIAFEELNKNVYLNKDLLPRVTLANLAISNLSGTVSLYQVGDRWGNSASSILNDSTKSAQEIKSKTFQQFITEHSINDCNFIKIDIEGAEFIVLPTMKDYLQINKPTLLVEFHPMLVDQPMQKLESIRNVLKIYNHLYDEKFKEIEVESIFSSFRDKPDQTLRVVFTPLSLTESSKF